MYLVSDVSRPLARWEPLPPRPFSACAIDFSSSTDDHPSPKASATDPQRYGCAYLDTAPALARYRPFIKRTTFLAKIPGHDPSELTPGYVERLAALVASSQGGGCGSGASQRRLAGVYVRRGCVELLIETEEWGVGDAGEGEDGLAGEQEFDDDDDDLDADLDALCADGLPAPMRPDPGLPGTPPPLSPHATRRGGAAGHQLHADRSRRPSYPAAPNAEAGVEGQFSFPAACAQSRDTSGRSSAGSSGPGGRAGSDGSLDLAAIIRALQLHDDPDSASASADEDEMNASMEQFRNDAAPAAKGCDVGMSEDLQAGREPGAGAGASPRGARALSRGDSGLQSAYLIDVDYERQAGIEVITLHPRVLLPRRLSGTPQHGEAAQDDDRSRLAPRAQPSAPTGSADAAAASAPSPDDDLRPGSTVILRAVVSCAADLQPGCPPSPLEVLVRSHSRYVPVRARWTRMGPAAAVPGPSHVAEVEMEAEAELRLAPGSRAGPVTDVAARPDVNLPQLLDLELLEVPSRPGLALNELDEFLIDFGTFEFHSTAVMGPTAAAVAGAGAGLGGEAAPLTASLDAISFSRLFSLGTHLLRYVIACNWVHTAAHMRQLMAALHAGAEGPGAAAPPWAAVRAAALPRPGARPAQAQAAPAAGGSSGDGGDFRCLQAAESVGSGDGGHRLLALLLLAGQGRRAVPDDEAAFQEYADSWVFNQGRFLLWMDLLSLVALLFRTRSDLLAPSNMTALTACCGGALTMMAQPFLSRASWARLVNAYRFPRFVFYSATKCMVAFLGFPPPPGVVPYATGIGLVVMEGVLVPGASLLPTPVACVALALLCVSTACMLHTCGATVSFAAFAALRTWVVGVLTTVVCHMYMRLCFSRHQQRQHRRAADATTKQE
ncbi:hypothetical protein GPECTOR_21g634 [Gonium pectorale]|uniref:Uncharacterized protein n=1 Tax=Gonium pectorale TaxID=33097 RepID=A0A150GHT4_GONPE|nr:hypothetical protein GPECTOR_21g634 [Gonium pectorale]|eukprot:KXZ49408.1 hypothetical protein GPECTOR_21g634 [Gonium pectorale]